MQATQKQLIQSEKMASLGELTAGIAHEIQNPLNFVNNFSEVSKELLDEIREELDKGNLEDAKEFMQDVIQNLEKIHHHGKRADGIVKGMLQHSRTGSGQMEPTDINALCDEYLRLSYHGLRAKDKSFNARFETHFDQSVGKINVLPQDLGRVILNLINNAFYAVSAKASAKADSAYEPTVEVSTTLSPLPGRGAGGEVSIIVKDNGTGIPQKVLDKIFQPFFTAPKTKSRTMIIFSQPAAFPLKTFATIKRVRQLETELRNSKDLNESKKVLKLINGFSEWTLQKNVTRNKEAHIAKRLRFFSWRFRKASSQNNNVSTMQIDNQTLE